MRRLARYLAINIALPLTVMAACHREPPRPPSGDEDGCTGARCVEQAEAAMYYGDHAGAREPLALVCEGGDGFACFRLAELHQHGRGGPVDLAKATALYEAACAGKHAEGCERRADFAREDAEQGAPLELEYALKACDGGRPLACMRAAQQLAAGRGIERDTNRAIEVYQAACRLGEAEGCAHAGDLLSALKPTPETRGRAFAAYNSACKGHNGHGCLRVAVAYYEGLGLKADVEAARVHFTRACDFLMEDGCRAAQQLAAANGKPVVLEMTTTAPELALDGLEARGLSCRMVEHGLPMLEEVLASVADHKAALDACAKDGAALAVTWQFASGRVRDAKVEDKVAPKLAKCVVAGLRRAKVPATGACKAVLLLGAPDGAARALAARAAPQGNRIRVSHDDED